MRWALVAVLAPALALALAPEAGATEEDDDPKSSLSELPTRPKRPPPVPPAPDGGVPLDAGAPGLPAPRATPGPAKAEAEAKPASPAQPGTSGVVRMGAPPAAPAPAAPPQRVIVVPPPRGAPAPGGLRDVTVPPGQSLDQAAAPGVITDLREGMGEVIAEIRVVENSKTDAVTVEYLAGVKRGMVLTPELVEKARERLLSSGLFKTVGIWWEKDPRLPAGVRLVVAARDKHSWVVAPLFAYSAQNVGGGIAYAESNAFGKNKKFLVLGEYTTAEKLLFLVWLDPQIRNTAFYYRVDLLLRRDSIVEYAAGQAADPRRARVTDVDTVGAGLLFGVNFTRRLHLDVRFKAYYDNVQEPTCLNTTNLDGSGTPDVVAAEGGHCRWPSSSGWDNTLNVTFGYDGRSRVYGVLAGLNAQAAYQVGGRWLGDRFDYHLLTISGMYGWRFFKEHNLLLKLGADVFFDPPFKLEVETGGLNMRGYLYRQFRGDTSVRATLEYILPLFTVAGLSLRLIGFYDTNLTWFRSLPAQDGPLSRFVVRGTGFRHFLPDSPSGVVRDSWHNGIGAGVRLYLRTIVLPLVGVDVAYGLDAGSLQVYFSLGSTLD